MAAQPLLVWLFFAGVAWILRRDRRLLARCWAIGLGTVAAAALGYTLWRLIGRRGPLDETDGVALRELLALASGFAIPLLVAWIPATWREVRRAIAWLGTAIRRRRLAGVSRTADLDGSRATSASLGWISICILVSVGCAAAYFTFGRQLGARGVFEHTNTLFDADPATYQDVLAVKIVGHKHPGFALLWAILCRGPGALAGPWATLAVTSTVGGLCVGLAAVYFRLVTRSCVLAVLLALLLGASAGHLVFAAVPESYIFSAFALIGLHVLVAWRGAHFRHQVGLGVLAGAVTITNAIPALACYLSTGRRCRRPRAILRWLACCLAVGGLWVTVQNWLLPQAAVALQPSWFLHDTGFTHSAISISERVGNLARGLFLEGVVGAPPRISQTDGEPELDSGPYVTVLSRVTAVAWMALLAPAVCSLLFRPVGAERRWPPTLMAAVACLALAAALYATYGNEHLFLYSCTFAFYVVAIAAHGLARLPHRLVIGVSLVVLLLLVINNARFALDVLAALDRLTAD